MASGGYPWSRADRGLGPLSLEHAIDYNGAPSYRGPQRTPAFTMAEAIAYFRGNFVPLAEAKVSVMTHALHYGTAIFEGIRGNWSEKEGKMFIFRPREHYERLLQGCRIMLLNIPYSADELCDITVEFAHGNHGH